jgi:hypothetical protein
MSKVKNRDRAKHKAMNAAERGAHQAKTTPEEMQAEHMQMPVDPVAPVSHKKQKRFGHN